MAVRDAPGSWTVGEVSEFTDLWQSMGFAADFGKHRINGYVTPCTLVTVWDRMQGVMLVYNFPDLAEDVQQVFVSGVEQQIISVVHVEAEK